MPKLPHIRNNAVANEQAEALTLNQFFCQIIPPAGVVTVDWLSDEIKSISGLEQIDAVPALVEQMSRGHKRVFMGAFLDDSTLTLTFTFNLNLHGDLANDAIIYRMFKEWARKGRDDRTGANSLKRDYTGQIILEQHNVVGEVWRKIEASRVIISEGITGIDEVSLENGEPAELVVVLTLENPELEVVGEG